MLLATAKDIPSHHQIYYAPHRPMPHRQSELPYFDQHQQHDHHHIDSMGDTHMSPTLQSQQDAAVAQALEIARESPDGAQDPTVSKILEQALSHIWAKVQAHPGSYVMTRDEFAVFNFFQHRFAGNKTAIMARKRYWDQTRA